MAKHIQNSPAVVWYPRIVALVVATVLALAAWGTIKLLRGGGDDADAASSSSTSGGDDAAKASGQDGGSGPAQGSGTKAASTAAPASAAAAVAPGCRTVHVWADDDMDEALRGAAERASDDCTTFTVTAKSGPAAAALVERQGGGLPAVWVPASEVLPASLLEAGADLEIGDTVASSPVVLAATRAWYDQSDVSKSIKAGKNPSWAQLVKMAKTPLVRAGDPRTDGASVTLLAHAAEQLRAAGAKESDVNKLLVVLATTALKGDPIESLESGDALLVPATQAEVDADGDLASIDPADGAGELQYPAVTFPSEQRSDKEQAAVDRLLKELFSEETVADIEAQGLAAGATADPVDPKTAVELSTLFEKYAPTPYVLAVMDISGSMKDPIPGAGGATRIDFTTEATNAALETLPGTTAIGLWEFSSGDKKGEQDWYDIFPVRPLDEEVDGTTQRQLLIGENNRLTNEQMGNDTGLYDTIYAAWKNRQEAYTKGQVQSVLLLTDGNNEDPTGGMSLSELLTKLKEEDDPDRPVTVVLVGVGPDVDMGPLNKIADAVKGKAIPVKEELNLSEVLVGVVAERSR